MEQFHVVWGSQHGRQEPGIAAVAGRTVARITGETPSGRTVAAPAGTRGPTRIVKRKGKGKELGRVASGR